MSAPPTPCEKVLRVSISLYVASLVSGIALSLIERPGLLAIVPCLILLAAIATMIYAINLREGELEQEEANDA